MKTPCVTILQHSSIVRPYSLFEHFKKMHINVELCTFVPTLHALGWNEPTHIGPVLLLGGPQSIYEMDLHPWLEKEITYVKKCIDSGARAFGICLGGQILSHILGAEVKKSPEPEVGWYPIQISKEAASVGLKEETLNFFQWHFDAFSLPKNAVPLFTGAAPNNCQGFLWNDQILALQFHPEMTHEGALLLCNRYSVPMGTQLDASPCKKTDFEKNSAAATLALENMLLWFLKTTDSPSDSNKTC